MHNKNIGKCSLLKLTKSQCLVEPKNATAGKMLKRAIEAEKISLKAKKLNKKLPIINKIPTIRAEI